MTAAAIQLTCGSRDLTRNYSDLTFSNVDPGGFETLQATTADAADVEIGDEVVVRSGLDVAWHGRVNEIGQREVDGRSITQLAAVGYSAKLSDERLSMIYVDRDLSHWASPSSGRQVTLLNNFSPNVHEVKPSQLSRQALWMSLRGPWTTAPGTPMVEPWYDAGSGNLLTRLYFEWDRTGTHVLTADANYNFFAYESTDDAGTGLAAISAGDIWPAGAAAQALTVSSKRYVLIEWFYANVAAGSNNVDYGMYCWNVATYGDHGLTRRGSEPTGFYPGDIAGHANTNAATGFQTVIGDSSTLTVGHSVYREPVAHQTIIGDMATLMGWHWGVWEPADALSSTPRLFFTAPPTAPTVITTRSQITDLDAPRVRVDRLYDTAKVKWQDPGGAGGITTVTTANPLTTGAGVSGRTLDLDMGQGNSTSATAFGTFALNLALAAARGGGSGTVPDLVAGPYGAVRPACLLRSGRDRIRITDLPDAGSWTEADENRQDSFLVRRVETTVKNGLPSTRIEFDGGADLLDVLNARLALAAVTGSAV